MALAPLNLPRLTIVDDRSHEQRVKDGDAPGKTPHSFLHLSIDGKAACDGRVLDTDLTSASPECRGMLICNACWRLKADWAPLRKSKDTFGT